jgi:hypothetical protein
MKNKFAVAFTDGMFYHLTPESSPKRDTFKSSRFIRERFISEPPAKVRRAIAFTPRPEGLG